MKGGETMPCVFEYTDYRKYLLDCYNQRKSENPSFSYNTLATKAGFKNKGFVHSVIRNRKNLSKTSIVRLAEALGLKPNEADYFENLVFFNQAADLKERNYFWEKLSGVKNHNGKNGKARQLTRDHYEFYSTWYHSAIRSLIDMFPVRDNFDWLAKNVQPAITKKQARASVALLYRLGLIKRQRNECWVLTDKHITTGNEILDLAALNYHRDATRLSTAAIESIPKHKRNITGLTMGLSQEAYSRIVEETSAFRKRIVQIVDESGQPADRVYQFNLHLFPMSKIDIKAPSQEKADWRPI
jgi:uncharacterized protein (TIGR02147 family)